MRLVRRMGKAGRGYLLHTVIRLYPCQLDRRTAGGMFHGKDVRPGVMEFNGDVYTCDHFVFPEYKLGNIHQNTLVEMMYGERQQAFGLMKQQSLPTQCRECEWLFACNGECPKNRFACTADGEPGLNYLCAGYHKFFSHVAPYMDFMKNELMNQRPPANIMEAIRNNAIKP